MKRNRERIEIRAEVEYYTYCPDCTCAMDSLDWSLFSSKKVFFCRKCEQLFQLELHKVRSKWDRRVVDERIALIDKIKEAKHGSR